MVPQPPQPARTAVRPERACTGVAVTPSGSRAVQRLLDANPPGTTFCFASGIYRFADPIDPKSGQRLIARKPGGAVLDGAVLLQHFQRSGNAYVARGRLERSGPSGRNCVDPASLCDTRQDVFWDFKPLVRVTSRAQVAAGTYYEDFAANQVWVGKNPLGHLVEQAYAPALIWSQNGGIVVDGFAVQFAASQAQQGAIQSYGYSGTGWTIRGNLVRFNHAAGIASVPQRGNSNGTLIDGNVIDGNGQEGIAAVGDSLTVRRNQIAFNNRDNYSCWWECGGAKFAGGPGYESRDLTVEDNDVHDNNGPGFWNDINSYNMLYRNNRVVRNVQTHGPYGYSVGAGIFVEISDRAVIERNQVADNGPAPSKNQAATFYLGGQIEVSASANVTVRDNRVSGAAGIGMLQQARSDSCVFGTGRKAQYPDGTPVCPHVYRGKPIHWAHDNAFTGNTIAETAMPGYAEVAGLDCDLHDDNAAFAPANANVYANNAYRLRNRAGTYFSWRNTLLDAAAWQAAGQDTGSSFAAAAH